MDNGTVSRLHPKIEVTAWQKEPGVVLEIAIGKTLTLEQMEELARLTAITVRMTLKLARIGGTS